MKLAKKRKHSDSDSEDSDSDDSDADDDEERTTSGDVLNETLMVMVTEGMLKHKLMPVEDGDYMKLTYNRLTTSYGIG